MNYAYKLLRFVDPPMHGFCADIVLPDGWEPLGGPSIVVDDGLEVWILVRQRLGQGQGNADGHSSRPAKDRLRVNLVLALSEEEIDQVYEAAARSHKGPAAFVAQCVRDALRKLFPGIPLRPAEPRP